MATIRLFIGIVFMSVLLTALGYAGTVITTIRVTATNGIDVGSSEFVITAPDASDWFEWTLDGGRNIAGNDNGDLLGSIESLKFKVLEDPATSVEFFVVAGNLATTFNIVASSVTTFDPITNPVAYASAGITLTDRNQNGAAVTGLYDGKAYQAIYNGSSVYANLVDSFTAGIRKTITQGEDRPIMGGAEIIGDTLFSIDSGFYFTLSAGDSAAGTSYFEVSPIPEPATVALLACGLFGTTYFKRK